MRTTLFILTMLFSLISCKNDKVENNEDLKSLIEGNSKLKEMPKASEKINNLNLDYCMGKFVPDKSTEFAEIHLKYADRAGQFLRKDVLDAFVLMFEAAQKDGVKLVIRSATRNFDYQKGIWERKWTGATPLSDGTNIAKDINLPIDKALKILEYSSMPGTSRHHWGTDIDLNSFSNSYFEKGEGKKIYDWLLANAVNFGFCQPYTEKNSSRPNGYNEEKWHWTYYSLSSTITDFAEQNLKNEMISGFKGSETAIEIDVVNNYILGINQGCRH